MPSECVAIDFLERCTRCGTEWTSDGHTRVCPKCGHSYAPIPPANPASPVLPGEEAMAPAGRYRRTTCTHCGSVTDVVSGAWLRWAREQAGVSLTEMASRVGHSKSYLSDIERDRRAVTRAIDHAYLSLPRILP